jgi:CheY-like chemotaxis protein
LRLDLALEPALPRALLDRPQLEQVIMNLVINARDAVPAGGTVSLRTRTGELGSEGGGSARAVLLEVADDGVGFGDEVRARLFEPFFTTKEAGRGTGLGLSTVYGIVKQSGGEIEVDSTPGVGARFRIRLPAVEGAAPAAEAVAPRALAAHGRKVLVVEEDAPLRALMARALRLSGFEVVEAGSASEALELDNGFGLVVAALGLSDRSGTELVARLRERTPDLPVVYCAGEPGTMPAGHEGAPALDGPLLRKPFSVPELQEAVRAAL